MGNEKNKQPDLKIVKELELPPDVKDPDEEHWEELKELPITLDKVAPYTSNLLPEPVNEWIEDNAYRMSSAPDYFAASAILGFSSLLAGRIRVYLHQNDEDWYEYSNLSGFICGEPGTKKSPSMNKVMAAFYAKQKEYDKAYEEENKIYQAEFRKYKRDLKKYDREYEQTKGVRGQEPVEPEAPVWKKIIVTSGTIEKFNKIYANNYSLIYHCDELLGFFRTLEKNGHESDLDWHKQRWSGKNSTIHETIGGGTSSAFGSCETIMGCMNPNPLVRRIAAAVDEGENDDGFTQRLQVMVMPDIPQLDDKPVDETPKTSDKIIEDIVHKLLQTSFAPFGNPPGVHFSSEAQPVLDNYLMKLRGYSSNMRYSPGLRKHFAKYDKLVASLSLIFHMLDYIRFTRNEPEPISLKALEYAVRYTEYLKTHAIRIYQLTLGMEMKTIKEILRRIEVGDIVSGTTLRELHQRSLSGLTDRKKVIDAMEFHEEYNYLKLKREPKGRIMIIINPKVLEKKK